MRPLRLLSLALASLVTACANEPVQGPPSPARRVVVAVDFTDVVFATRLEGPLMAAGPAAATDWDTDGALARAVTAALAEGGREATVVPTEGAASAATSEGAAAVSRAMRTARPEATDDLHLILFQVPIDSRPLPATGRELRAMLGLVSAAYEAGAAYRAAYAVRYAPLSTDASGRVQCISYYGVVAIDPVTGAVVENLVPRRAERRLPDDLEMVDYATLDPAARALLRRTCQGALVDAVLADLGKLGLR